MIFSWFWKGAVVLATGAACLAQAPTPKVIAITGARLLTVSHGTIENGVLVMADGKIAAVGENGKVKIPADAQTVDGKGMTVYPGLIDPESNFGHAHRFLPKITRPALLRGCKSRSLAVVERRIGGLARGRRACARIRLH